ncbi:hypothetical protein [Fuscovulum blasticum]|uniref:hypothetical protein n=1 Tax=Fuscovulum blasticum TaxID=1075 RepID=UPI000D3E4125|nr:hypothetical protein [Fuscovulum blasticum]AWD21589.1 hypothetical protein B6K69_07805 [Fuscovulum blasticum]
MIRYSFDPHLIPRIQSGLICQTFRQAQTGHARVGDRIRLTRIGSKDPIIPDPVCLAVEMCELVWTRDIAENYCSLSSVRQAGMPIVHLEKFAISLGYPSFAEFDADLATWFDGPPASGVIISWAPPAPDLVRMAA